MRPWGGVWNHQIVCAILMVLSYQSLDATTVLESASLKVASMGGSAVVMPMDGDALAMNPAGMVLDAPSSMVLGFGSFYSQMMQTALIGVGVPLSSNLGFMAAAATRVMGDIPDTIMGPFGTGLQVGQFSDTESEFRAGVCWEVWPQLQLGSSVGYTHHTILDAISQQVSIDVGGQVKLDRFQLGGVIKNVFQTPIKWHDDTVERVPMTMGLGMGVSLFPSLSVYSGLLVSDRATVSLSVVNQWWEGVSVTLSFPQLNESMQPNAGVSCRFQDMTFQYAFSQHEALGSTHHIGVLIDW